MRNINTKISVKIVKADKAINGRNCGYIFAGRKVYIEWEPRRYMRIMGTLSPWIRQN
jgi:hypothetical protein